MAKAKNQEQLQEKLAAAQSEKEALLAELEKSAAVIVDLSNSKDAAIKAGKSAVVATFENTSYEVVVPKFLHKGKTYTAQDVAKTPDLLKELVNMNSGILKALSK